MNILNKLKYAFQKKEYYVYHRDTDTFVNKYDIHEYIEEYNFLKEVKAGKWIQTWYGHKPNTSYEE